MPHTPNASTPRSVHRFVLCVFTTLALVASSSFAEAQDSLPSWTNTSGKTIQAEFIRLDGETLEIRKDGKLFRVPLQSLAPESQEQAKELAKKPSESLPEGRMSKPSRDGDSADTLKLSEKEMKFINLCLANRNSIKSLGLAGNLASFARDMTADDFRDYYKNNKPRTPRFHLNAAISKLDSIEEYRRKGKLDEETRNSFLASAATEMSFQMIAKHGSDLDGTLESKTEQDYRNALSKLVDELRSVFGDAKEPVVNLDGLREKEQELLQLLKNKKDLDRHFRIAHFQFAKATGMPDEDFVSYFDGEFTKEYRLPKVYHNRYLDTNDEYFRRAENAKSPEKKLKIVASSAPQVVDQSLCLRRCRIAGNRFPFSEKRYEEQLSRMIDYIKEFSQNQVAEADKYVHDRSPTLDAAWERVLARVKREMGEKGWAASLTKVAVIRVRLEDEELEDKVLVGSEGLCFPSVVQYDSYSQFVIGFSEKVTSGGFITVAVNPANPPPDGRSPVLKVAGLKHYSAATKIDFTEGDVVCGGEILLKSVPKESMGQLIVRCIPESGISIGGGTINIAPDGIWSEKFKLGDDGIVNADIAPGKYTVRSGRDLELQGPSLEDVVVRPNETTEVGLKLFRPRVVELEWCCRNPRESLEWKRGTSRVKSGGNWNESRFWNKYYGFYLSDWDGDGCTIQAYNCTSFVRSTSKELPIEGGAPLPTQPANFSDGVSFPIVKDAVFECHYDSRTGGDLGDFEIMFKVKGIEPVED